MFNSTKEPKRYGYDQLNLRVDFEDGKSGVILGRGNANDPGTAVRINGRPCLSLPYDRVKREYTPEESGYIQVGGNEWEENKNAKYKYWDEEYVTKCERQGFPIHADAE